MSLPLKRTPTNQQAFQMKGSLFTLSVLQLFQTDLDAFAAQLDNLVKQAPKFFAATPLVLDLQFLKEENVNINFKALTLSLIHI